MSNLADTRQAMRFGARLSSGELRKLVIYAVLFVLAALAPFVLGGYPLQLAISIAMYTALATSWLLFSGPTNYIALSTAAFFGIGMYTVAGGIEVCRTLYWSCWPVSPVRPWPAVVGLATLRVSGVYFVIFSLGLAELVRQVMTWLQHVLGTMSGIYVTIERSEQEYYWQLLLLTAVVYLVGWWIGRSRLGFALRSSVTTKSSPSIAASTLRLPKSSCSSFPACSLRSPALSWRRAGATSNRLSHSTRSSRFRSSSWRCLAARTDYGDRCSA